MEPPQFDVVLRGYDRGEVQALVERASAVGLSQADLDKTTLHVRLRGFDRHQVDSWLAAAVAGS